MKFLKKYAWAIFTMVCLIIAAVRVASGNLRLEDAILSGALGAFWCLIGSLLSIPIFVILWKINQATKYYGWNRKIRKFWKEMPL